MRKMAIVKSSFTLPPQEVSLVVRLKKKLHLPSNTAVVRRALMELEKRSEREELRRRFREASRLVRSSAKKEMKEMDHLAGEGIGEG